MPAERPAVTGEEVARLVFDCSIHVVWSRDADGRWVQVEATTPTGTWALKAFVADVLAPISVGEPELLAGEIIGGVLSKVGRDVLDRALDLDPGAAGEEQRHAG